MNKVISIIRIATLELLFSACFFLLCCEAKESLPTSTFILVMVICKVLGLIAGYAFYRCFKVWKHTDYYISRYIKWCNEQDC